MDQRDFRLISHALIRHWSRVQRLLTKRRKTVEGYGTRAHLEGLGDSRGHQGLRAVLLLKTQKQQVEARQRMVCPATWIVRGFLGSLCQAVQKRMGLKRTR